MQSCRRTRTHAVRLSIPPTPAVDLLNGDPILWTELRRRLGMADVQVGDRRGMHVQVDVPRMHAVSSDTHVARLSLFGLHLCDCAVWIASLALTPEAWVMSRLSRLSASGIIPLSSYVCLIKQITKCDKPKFSAQRTAGIRCVHRHLVSITFLYAFSGRCLCSWLSTCHRNLSDLLPALILCRRQ